MKLSEQVAQLEAQVHRLALARRQTIAVVGQYLADRDAGPNYAPACPKARVKPLRSLLGFLKTTPTERRNYITHHELEN